MTDKWGGDATTPHADAGAGAPAIGVALAGGASRRMGRDKTAIVLCGPLGGETLAARTVRHLRAVCADVVVADAGRGLVPGLPSLADGPGRGPAAGILGAALARPGRALLVLACDLPLLPTSLLAALLGASDAADWVVPRWEGRLEPLCALYRPAALAELAAAVARGVMAPHRLGDSATLRVRYLEGADLARHGAPERLFLNLNAPADLDRWLEIEAACAEDVRLD